MNPNAPRRAAIVLAVVLLTVVAATLASRGTHPPAPPTTTVVVPVTTVAEATPLNRNSAVDGPTGYALRNGALYDSAMSRGSGGSIKLGSTRDAVVGTPARVVAGRHYTISGFLRSATQIAPEIQLSAAKVDRFGRLSKILDFSAQSVDRADTWEEIAIDFTPTYTGYVSLFASRNASNEWDGTGDVWLDDLSVFEGNVSQSNDPGTREAFVGSQTRIDSLGNIQVLASGTWTRTGSTVSVHTTLPHWLSAGAPVAVQTSSDADALPVGANRVVRAPTTSTLTLKGADTGAASGRLTMWIEYFPMCVAANSNRTTGKGSGSWAELATAFNCNTWATADPTYPSTVPTLAQIDAARAVGMRSMQQLAQYTGTGYAHQNWGILEEVLRKIDADPAAKEAVFALWWDNETTDSFANYKAMIDTIRRVDVTGGVRTRPIVMLQSHTYARAFNADGDAFYDVSGSYYWNTGLSWINQHIPFTKPKSMCQINEPQARIRPAVYACIAQGGRMFSVFRDGTAAVGNHDDHNDPPPIETDPGWSDYPKLRTEISQLMPFIVRPESTRWHITTPANNDVLPVSMSTREVDGVAETILANLTDTAQTVTMQVRASTYPVYEVRDYFTNAVVVPHQAIVAAGGSSWQVTIPGNVYNVTGGGSMMLKLMPAPTGAPS